MCRAGPSDSEARRAARRQQAEQWQAQQLEAVQKALKQLPRPVMTSRTEASITVNVDRKNDVGAAGPRSALMFELQYRKQGDSQWATLRAETAGNRCLQHVV